MEQTMQGRARAPAATAAVPLVALLVDRTLGEPPVLHPVVGMGRLLARAARSRDRATSPLAATAAGAGALVGCLLVVTVAARVVDRAVGRLPIGLALPVEGALLSTLLADAMLRSEGRRVEAALGDGPAAGRSAVTSLVSRDPAHLDVDALRAATIESLAENTGDSVVGPLLAWAVAGLPGATAYRLVNTADASWGYRGPPWEWWGKAAARLDDLCNLVPARLAAVLLAPPTMLDGDGRRQVRQQARLTPSPNAGWPMAAVAVDRDLRLGKPGMYDLNPGGRAPGGDDVARVADAVARAAEVAAVLAVVLRVGIRQLRRWT
ncbi:adenosylcobinamide-phosphate synthase CbiB [Salsipaludibacter albus]|uniref:adenosylcobinamide-phosphate synthase CbiB n=1 Tax=Salsipaludibacter albus TaxID=2849650 RepID=UPI001EE4C85B|nr:adenosylcobinamide-phosphate synthase CbiB [Salsipaludibacter albus]